MLQVNYTEALNILVYVTAFAVISSEPSLELALGERRDGFSLFFCFRYLFHLSIVWRVITHFNPKATCFNLQ